MKRDVARYERRMQRVRSRGSVQVGDGVCWARGRIVDVSAGGIRVEADHDWLDGASVFLDVCFDADPGHHHFLTGFVRRAMANTLAIELDEPPTSFEAFVIDQLIAAQMCIAARPARAGGIRDNR